MDGSPRRRAPIRFLVIALSLMQGCGFFSSNSVLSVSIPTLPELWARNFQGLAFELVFMDGTGLVQKITVSESDLPVSISCARVRNSPVLAYPVLPASAAAEPGSARHVLKPAGGLFPQSLVPSGQTALFPLRWEQGPVAEVLLSLWEQGLDASLLNAERLTACLCAEPDPWVWDLAVVGQRISEGSFDARSVDRLPGGPARFNAACGLWFPESPCGSVYIAEGGILDIPEVPSGRHALFRDGGGMIEFFMDATGSVLGCVPGL